MKRLFAKLRCSARDLDENKRCVFVQAEVEKGVIVGKRGNAGHPVPFKEPFLSFTISAAHGDLLPRV